MEKGKGIVNSGTWFTVFLEFCAIANGPCAAIRCISYQAWTKAKQRVERVGLKQLLREWMEQRIRSVLSMQQEKHGVANATPKWVCAAMEENRRLKLHGMPHDRRAKLIDLLVGSVKPG